MAAACALTSWYSAPWAANAAAVSAQAAAIHQMFVATLQASAGSYAATEAANVTAAR